MLIATPKVEAIIIDWDGNQSVDGNYHGTFDGANNWNPDQIPVAVDAANFNVAAVYTVTLDSNVATGEIRVVDGHVTVLSDSTTARTYNVTTGNMDANVSGGELTIGSSTNPVVVNVGDIMNIGSNASGANTVTVSGGMSELNATAATIHNVGRNGRSGFLVVTDDAAVTYGGTLRIGVDNNSVGVASVDLGGMLNTGSIEVATVGTNGSGTLQVSAVGSSINQNIAGATLTIGSDAGKPGAIHVRSGSVFSTGSGVTTVNATGTVNVGSAGDSVGTLDVNGDLLIDGGTLQVVSHFSQLNLATGTTMTVENGGQWILDPGGDPYHVHQDNTINLDGEGTLLDFTGHRFRLHGDSTMNVTGGADVLIHTNFDIGNGSGNGALTVSGVGTTVIADPDNIPMWWGRHESDVDVTFTDGAVGSFLGGVEMMNSSSVASSPGTATTTVGGGAQVTFGDLYLAAADGTALGEAILTVVGDDSLVSIDGTSSLNVGKAAGGSAQLLIASGATLQMGIGEALVGATGSVTVADATLNASGNVNLVGGTLTANSDGIVSVNGQFVVSSSGTLTIDGGEVNANAGLSFTTGMLQFRDGTLTIRNGALEINSNEFLGNYVVHGSAAGDLPHLRLGAGATAAIPNEIAVGAFGASGAITILEGGQVSSKVGRLALDFNTGGSVTVAGTDGLGTPSKWNASELMEIGAGGTGILTILGGGEVSSGITTLGAAVSGDGTLTVSGNDSKSSHSLGLFVGGDTSQAAGTGRVFLFDGGLVEVDGALTIWETGTVTLDGGILKVDSNTASGNGSINFLSGNLHLTDAGGYTVGANSGPVDQSLGYDQVTLPNGGGLVVDETLTVPSPNSLTAVAGVLVADSLVNDGVVNLNQTSLTTNSGVVNNGDVVLINSAVEGPIDNAAGSTVTVLGDVDFNGLVSGSGNFFGPGVAHFNGGMSPGSSPGLVTIESSVRFAASNTLFIELGGLSAGDDYDVLHIGGAIDLDGVLEVSLLDDFMPTAGETFNLLIAAGGVSGQFVTTINDLPGLTENLAWEIDYGSNSVALSVVAALPGDYNFDGLVNAADYTVWRDGGSPDSSLAGYDLWTVNYGTPASATMAQSVPEATAAVSSLLAFLGTLARHRVG